MNKPDFINLYLSDRPAESSWFVVEMKGRAKNIGHISRQLQAGAQMIQEAPLFQLPQTPKRLVPLVLHERGISLDDARELTGRISINFQNNNQWC